MTPAYRIWSPPPAQAPPLPAGSNWGDLITPPPEEVAWWVYREAFARMCRAVFAEYAVPAIVRSGWHLRLKIGETLEMVKNGPVQTPRLKEAEGEVRGWMLNFERFQQPAPEQQTIGTNDLPITFGVTAWGIHGYSRRTGADSAQARLEQECRLLMWAVRKNTKWGLLGRASELMQDVSPLQFPSVDLHGFQSGPEAFIAQGQLTFVVVEQDTRPEPE